MPLAAPFSSLCCHNMAPPLTLTNVTIRHW